MQSETCAWSSSRQMHPLGEMNLGILYRDFHLTRPPLSESSSCTWPGPALAMNRSIYSNIKHSRHRINQFALFPHLISHSDGQLFRDILRGRLLLHYTSRHPLQGAQLSPLPPLSRHSPMHQRLPGRPLYRQRPKALSAPPQLPQRRMVPPPTLIRGTNRAPTRSPLLPPRPNGGLDKEPGARPSPPTLTLPFLLSLPRSTTRIHDDLLKQPLCPPI